MRFAPSGQESDVGEGSAGFVAGRRYPGWLRGRGRAVALQAGSSFSWSSAWLPGRGGVGDHGQPVAGQAEGVTGRLNLPDHPVAQPLAGR
jgi:hypothetical protein